METTKNKSVTQTLRFPIELKEAIKKAAKKQDRTFNYIAIKSLCKSFKVSK